MFSIFSTQGTVFRGALEDLRRVSKTLAVVPSPPINALTAHMDDVDTQPFKRLLQAWPERVDDDPYGSTHSHGSPEGLGLYLRVRQPPPPEREPLVRVEQVMSTTLVTVTVTAELGLGDAWRLLQTHDVGQAPVVDAEGRLVGLFTRAQFLRWDRLPGPEQPGWVWQAWVRRPVAEVMVSPVPAVHPATALRRVARVLVDAGLPGLPVVSDADQLVGFVSRTDVLRALVHDPPLDLWT